MALTDYESFITSKAQAEGLAGFDPGELPSFLFDFQAALVDWALRKGRAAIFASCGLGKTAIELAWADAVLRHTNRPVLILTPLAVSGQTIAEGAKFGIEARRVVPGMPITSGIWVTNYERLHHLEPSDFGAVIADESSCLKHFGGATQKAVERFLLKMPYRLLATATPSPNDYMELGTSSGALGYLGHTEMLTRFFKQRDSKEARIEDVKAARRARNGNHFAKLAFRVSQTIGQWRLKGHAIEPFWRWVASWARACRKPSDVGPFDDGPFVLPDLVENHHIVTPKRPADGMLFTQPAFGLSEEREERRRTLDERCQLVASLVAHDRPAIAWCQLNAEGDLLERLIPGSVQVSGSDTDEMKESKCDAFLRGDARVMISKSVICGWGLNWQHCADVVTFASHSYEQYHQSIRRCWRFGQKRPVTVHIVSTEGEVHVRDNMQRKTEQAEQMYDEIVRWMGQATSIRSASRSHSAVEVPPWM